MGDGFQVQPPALRDGGRRLQEIAQRLTEEWTSFAAGVQARGDIFGDDDVGGLIAASYQAAHQLAEGCYLSAADAFGGFGDGLNRMAERYEQADEDQAGLFRQLEA